MDYLLKRIKVLFLGNDLPYQWVIAPKTGKLGKQSMYVRLLGEDDKGTLGMLTQSSISVEIHHFTGLPTVLLAFVFVISNVLNGLVLYILGAKSASEAFHWVRKKVKSFFTKKKRQRKKKT